MDGLRSATRPLGPCSWFNNAAADAEYDATITDALQSRAVRFLPIRASRAA